MGVPYVFGNATTSIPLTNLDANFNTGLTIGNTTVGLGNTVTTLGNVTLTNATIVANTSSIAANAVVYTTSTGNLTGNASVFSVNGSNVGIGTSSPTVPLQIGNFAGEGLRLTSTSTNGSKLQLFSNAQSTNQFQIGQGYASGTDNIAYIYNGANADMLFATNATERMRINSSGFVGISTSSPNFPLTVVSNGAYTAAAGFFSPNASYFNLALACGYGNANMYISSAGTTDESLRFINSGGGEVLRIQKTGGITFNNSSALTNSTLNDYETGTWTPVMNPGSTTTYTSQNGRYTKIGNMVYAYFSITINAINTANTTKLYGLPFTSYNSGTVQTSPICYWVSAATAFTYLVGYVENNSTDLSFAAGTTASQTISTNGPAVFGSGTTLIGTAIYQANF